MAGKRRRFANSSGGWTYLPKEKTGKSGRKRIANSSGGWTYLPDECPICKGPHVYKHGRK